jgi:uncharacterized protein (TIGR03083 family)
MTEHPYAAWDHQRFCALTETEIARFASAIAKADPATPVPTCPDWTLAGLAKHLGIVHRWVEHILRNGLQTRISSRDVPVVLPDGGDWADWIADGGAALVAVLRATAPEAPIWSWGGDQRAAYWSRRMLHETVVHRADAELALGLRPDVAAEIAVDGIDEFFANLPFFADAVPAGAGETLHLHATDHPGEWTITLTPEGFGWTHGHAKCDVAVQATATDLMLLLNRRIPQTGDGLTVFGKPDVLSAWLEKSAF